MPKLVAMMITRNEADRYLRICLNDLVQYVDRIVILDDGSTDQTPAICSSFRNVHLIRNTESRFWIDESMLRRQCWEETIKQMPEWILAIDADELVENRMKIRVKSLINQSEYDQISFQLVEFWGSMNYYRVDKLWNPQNRWGVYLIRYHQGYPYQWSGSPLHCGRLPINLPGRILSSGLRLKHYGYANKAEHRRKYEAYLRRDPEGKYCPLSHYLSIIDPNPVLKKWFEGYSVKKGTYSTQYRT